MFLFSVLFQLLFTDGSAGAPEQGSLNASCLTGGSALKVDLCARGQAITSSGHTPFIDDLLTPPPLTPSPTSSQLRVRRLCESEPHYCRRRCSRFSSLCGQCSLVQSELHLLSEIMNNKKNPANSEITEAEKCLHSSSDGNNETVCRFVRRRFTTRVILTILKTK